MLASILALTLSGIFTGAAFYINFAEQPARLLLDPSALVTEWVPSYRRGLIMQSSIAILTGVLGGVAFYQTSDPLWAIGAVVMVLNWPFTLFVMMPINKQIEATTPESAGQNVVKLIRRWGVLHAVRTFLGATSTILFIFALSS